MSCNGVCTRYKAKIAPRMGVYKTGAKRCQLCEIFIVYDGKHCPCCGYRLRTKPRNMKYKTKYKEAMKDMEAIKNE